MVASPPDLALKLCVCGHAGPPVLKWMERAKISRRLECPHCGFHGAKGRHIATIRTNWNRAISHAKAIKAATHA